MTPAKDGIHQTSSNIPLFQPGIIIDELYHEGIIQSTRCLALLALPDLSGLTRLKSRNGLKVPDFEEMLLHAGWLRSRPRMNIGMIRIVRKDET